jgi:hypothetical protein
MSASQLFVPGTTKINTAQFISPATAPIECSLARSGIATILATNDNVQVTLAGVSDSSVILATLHCDNGVAIDATATHVTAVVTAAGSFRIYVNAAATLATKVSWVVASL